MVHIYDTYYGDDNRSHRTRILFLLFFSFLLIEFQKTTFIFFICKDETPFVTFFPLSFFFLFFLFRDFFSAFGVRGKKRRHKKIQSTLFLCVVGRSSVVRVSLSQFQTHALSLLFARSLSLFLVQQKREEERVRKESSTANLLFSFWDFPSNFLPVSQSHRKKC